MLSLPVPYIPQTAYAQPINPQLLARPRTPMPSTTEPTPHNHHSTDSNTIHTFCDSPPNSQIVRHMQAATRPPLSSEDLALRLYVTAPQPVHGTPPSQTSGCTDIVSCVVVTSPSSPVHVGSRVILIEVRNSHTTTTTTGTDNEPSSDVFIPNSTVAIGDVTHILSMEKHAITFVVHNTRFPYSRVAFAHVTVEYRPGKTVSLGMWARLRWLLSRHSFPDTRHVPLSTTYILSQSNALPPATAQPPATPSDTLLTPPSPSNVTVHESSLSLPLYTYPPQMVRPIALTLQLSSHTPGEPSTTIDAAMLPALSPMTPPPVSSSESLIFSRSAIYDHDEDEEEHEDASVYSAKHPDSRAQSTESTTPHGPSSSPPPESHNLPFLSLTAPTH